jgi:hypothetical protein
MWPQEPQRQAGGVARTNRDVAGQMVLVPQIELDV